MKTQKQEFLATHHTRRRLLQVALATAAITTTLSACSPEPVSFAFGGKGKEPDIFAVFFDTPVGVQEAEDATGAVVVIEFKRHGRNDYKTDPAQQVIKRFVEIKHGGVTNIDGRPINATGLRYLGYTSTDNHETTRGPAAQLDFNYQATLDPASDGKPRSRAR